MDVQNAVIGLQQARARYDAAVKARVLAQQTLEADQKKFHAGRRQRRFRWCRISATWQRRRARKCRPWPTTRMRESLSTRRWATTLEVNNISVAEALAGHVERKPGKSVRRR